MPNDLTMTVSDTGVQMANKTVWSAVSKEGFQKEVRTELRFRGFMNGQERNSQRGGRREFLAREREYEIKLRHER